MEFSKIVHSLRNIHIQLGNIILAIQLADSKNVKEIRIFKMSQIAYVYVSCLSLSWKTILETIIFPQSEWVEQ